LANRRRAHPGCGPLPGAGARGGWPGRTTHGEEAAAHHHAPRDTLVDDYYWLRNKGTAEVEEYLKAELAHALAFMKPTEALQQTL